jgi:serine/threonine protein kinase
LEEYDARSDVWSLGITMAELIINKLPYDLPQKIHPEHVYITLHNIILNIKPEEILYRCFDRNGFSCQEEYSSEFLELCLKEYKTRPQCQELIETSFYKTFSKITKEMLEKNLSAQHIQENQESDVSNKFKIVSIFVYILLKEKNSKNTQRTQFVLNIPRYSTIIDAENKILEKLQLDADFVAFEKCEKLIPQLEVSLGIGYFQF